MQVVTNWFVNKYLRYEKRNDISHRLSHRWVDTGFLLEHARDHYHHDTSNHRHGSSATASFANNDNNNTQRLLRQETRRGTSSLRGALYPKCDC
jgi:hypothetical protein